MTDMIEQVTRAIADADAHSCTYEQMARAAIAAMREPSDEMFATAAHSIGGADRVRAVWDDLIDAALKEGEG